MATATVYQDLDPLGRGEWFGYVTGSNGHITANFGPFPDGESARRHAVAIVGSPERVLSST